MSSISNAVPLAHVVRSIQEPWLDHDNPTSRIAVLSAVVATAGWVTVSKFDAF